MASGKNQFGVFGGVFTPSILTILGVIMYLRLPWVVGQGGLVVAIGIILAAHVVSVTTGLSISSIATDKKVGAGGPYYIISRSLGLPIGGTLGFALFTGLSFSVSLYIIGFTESFLNVMEIEPSGTNIRLCGTVTLIALTVLTLISTSLALKTQYLILGLIALSLFSVFAGNPDVPAAPAVEAAKGAPAIAVLFGIFFPAVTGFTAGVNMSGDLKDPKKAIPVGTLAAIFTGLAIYLGLALYVGYRVDRELLLNDPQVLTKVALWPPAVVAGIWGATLSSAIGSILGAPRILQALSADGVFFRFFAKGAGKTAEPRRALVFAFLIAWSGILIGELNAIANIVSMFFMAMYCVLNLSCALEIWASTDFRPDFRISKWWGIVGAITALSLMINLDIFYTLATALIFVALFSWLKRRELQLEGGDTWQGVWSSVVRSGLTRLAAAEGHQRHWRPNIMAFAPATAPGPATPLFDFGATLVRERGVLTHFHVEDPGKRPAAEPPPGSEGVFHRRVASADRYQAIEGALRHYGFAGMEPNAVLLDYDEHKKNPEGFARVLNATGELDYNLLLLHNRQDEATKRQKRIDIWWASGRGSIPFSLSLTRFLTQTDRWRDATVRFLFVTDEDARADNLIRETERLLAEARATAQVKVFDSSLGDRHLEDWVRKESADAQLTLLGVPQKMNGEEVVAWFRDTDALLPHLGDTLLIRGSSGFRESFAEQVQKRVIVTPEESRAEDDDVPEVVLPANTDVAAEVKHLTDAHADIVQTFYESALEVAYLNVVTLVEQVSGVVHREYGQLIKGLAKTESVRHRRAVTKARSALLFQIRKALDDFCTRDLVAQGDALARRTEVALSKLGALAGSAAAQLQILRDASEFAPAPDDDPYVADFKRRRRIARFFQRRTTPYSVQVGVLRRWYLGHPSEALLEALIQDCALDCFQSLRDLSKALEAVRRDFAALATASRQEGGLDEATVSERRDRAVQELASVVDTVMQAMHAARRESRREVNRLGQEYAADLDRLDVARVIQRSRKRVPPEARARRERLPTLPAAWTTNETLLLRRIELMILNASFQLRLSGIVQKTHEALVLQIDSGALREGEALLSWLKEAREEDDRQKAQLPKPAELRSGFDDKRLIDDLLREVQAASAELPEEIETLGDESLSKLASAPFDEPEVLTLSLRRMVEFLVGIELLQNLQRELAGIPDDEQRLLGVIQDILRLTTFHVGERDPEDAEVEQEEAEAWRDILEGSATRLETELAPLRGLAGRLEERLSELLNTIADRTDSYAIAGSVQGFKPYLSSDEGKQRALSLLERSYSTVEGRARSLLEALWYRRSAGQLLALRMARSTGQRETVISRLHEMVDEVSPPAEVLRALPFHYQQLFLRQARIGSEFWVGRELELEEARSAIRRHEEGARGAIFVIGERHAGKSALCRQICQRLLHKSQQAVHVFGPVGGSPDLRQLRHRLGAELGQRGTLHDVLRATPDGTAVVLHDLELWWERTESGHEVIDALLEAIDRHDDRLLFLVNASTPAFRLLHRLRPVADQALSIIEAAPMDAESLKEVIRRRHRSTGLGFKLEGKDESELASWAEARLFTRYFDQAHGRVGTALQTWIASTERVKNDVLHMRRPTTPDADVLRELKPEWTALLIELALHKQLTIARMERIAEMARNALHHDLRALLRSGLITQSHGDVLEINRFAHHLVIKHLRDREVLE